MTTSASPCTATSVSWPPQRRPKRRNGRITLEQIIGRAALALSDEALGAILTRYARTTIDLGTGDGRFVCARADDDATCLAIGIDAAREPLRAGSRKAPANALFLIANVAALPRALNGIASAVTFFFPYGSLLGLLCGEGCGMETVSALMLPGAALCLVLNAGAFGDCGVAFDDGITRVMGALGRGHFRSLETASLDASALRCSPTTWGRRLAFGRDPRAIAIRACKEAVPGPGEPTAN